MSFYFKKVEIQIVRKISRKARKGARGNAWIVD